MIEWWNELTTLHQIFLLVAIPATLVMLVQAVMLLFGLGDGEDADFDTDDAFDGVDGDGDLAIFSVRGVVTMFAVAGWSGFAFLDILPEIWAIVVAIALGVLALLGTAYLMRAVYRLQASGNIDVENAVGKVAEVYIPIPPKATGTGKVVMTLQEKYCELNALTSHEEKLKTGSYVRVVAVDGTRTLVVEPLGKKEPTHEE